MRRSSRWYTQPQHHGVRPDPLSTFIPEMFWMPQMGSRIWVSKPLQAIFGTDEQPDATLSTGLQYSAVAGGLGLNDATRTGNISWNRRGGTISYGCCTGAVFTLRSALAGTACGMNSSAGSGSNACRVEVGVGASGDVYAAVRLARTGGTTVTWSTGSAVSLDTPISVIVISRGLTDRVMFVNGQKFSNTTSGGVVGGDTWSYFTVQAAKRGANAPVTPIDGYVLMGFSSLTDPGDEWAQLWTTNPWSLVEPIRRRRSSAAVTVYQPGSDIIVADWVPSTGADLFACIDETTYDDADFISSPGLGTPTTMGFTSSVPAGTYTIQVRGRYEGVLVGQIRIVMLDAGSSVVGTSAWATQSGTFSTYSLPVTTTGTATKFRIETQ